MLLLQGITFEVDRNIKKTAFFVSENNNTIEFSIDISFKANEFDGEYISPSLDINFIETSAKTLEELIGISFEVKNIQESDEREDSFYIYEHEPFEQYEVSIISIEDDKAYIKCNGIAIVDGYSNPYKSAKFEFNEWLPIKIIN